MSKKFTLESSLVQFEDCIENWEDAIKLSANPLLEGGYIEEGYITAMIESVKEYGPYICIAPDIALPHARPEAGSLEVGFSVLMLKKPVEFSENPEHHSRALITLSCVDADTHLEMLQSIVETLSDEQKNAALFSATTKEEIVRLFE